jgi:hypothetical protein
MFVSLQMVWGSSLVLNLVLLSDRLDELRYELRPLICENFSKHTKMSENIFIKNICI